MKKQGKWNSHNCPSKYLECILVIRSLITMEKILIFGTDCDSLKRKKTSVTKSLYHNYCIQVKYTIPKYTKKETEKGICNFLRNNKKVRLPWHVAQLHIWKGGIGTLDTDTQLNSTKIKQIQSLLNPTNVHQKDLTLYQLNLALNTNQSLAL